MLEQVDLNKELPPFALTNDLALQPPEGAVNDFDLGPRLETALGSQGLAGCHHVVHTNQVSMKLFLIFHGKTLSHQVRLERFQPRLVVAEEENVTGEQGEMGVQQATSAPPSLLKEGKKE